MQSHQTIGFAGIAAHERNTIQYVQRIYPNQLSRVRDVADPQTADILFIDPLTPEGQHALQRKDAFLIALQDRRSPDAESADIVLYRPLRPRAVLDTLNSVEKPAITNPTPKLVSESAELTEILRNAIRGESGAKNLVLSNLGKTWLVIDPARDRIRGNTEQLTADRILNKSRQVFSRVPPHQASKLLENEPEQPLYRTLWSLAQEIAESAALFGDMADAHFRFECWPNFAEAGISGKLLRAVSLMRHGSFTVESASTRTGLDRKQLLVLLNGAWLTGELCLTDGAELTSQPTASTATRVNASVLARIRSRLSGA